MPNKREVINQRATLIHYENDQFFKEKFDTVFDSGKNKTVDFGGNTYYCRSNDDYYVSERINKFYALVINNLLLEQAFIDLKAVIREYLSKEVEIKQRWLDNSKEKLNKFDELHSQ